MAAHLPATRNPVAARRGVTDERWLLLCGRCRAQTYARDAMMNKCILHTIPCVCPTVASSTARASRLDVYFSRKVQRTIRSGARLHPNGCGSLTSLRGSHDAPSFGQAYAFLVMRTLTFEDSLWLAEPQRQQPVGARGSPRGSARSLAGFRVRLTRETVLPSAAIRLISAGSRYCCQWQTPANPAVPEVLGRDGHG